MEEEEEEEEERESVLVRWLNTTVVLWIVEYSITVLLYRCYR